jgi:hypothetical protein
MDIAANYLLKRLPLNRLLLYLGSQSWRLYELYQVIYGDLSALKLNHDLLDILVQICIKETKATKKPEEAASIRPAWQEKVLESENQAKNFQEKAQNPISQKANKKTKPELPELAKKAKFSPEQEKAQKFTGWLNTKIDSKDKRYRLNNGDLVFSQTLKYGCDCVFVSEHLFNKYQSINGIAASELKQALLIADLTDGKNYTVINDGRDISLTKIKHIPIEQEDLAVQIEEEL